MKVYVTAAALAAAMGLSSAALADSYLDVESARANARAGGPISEYDADLLERYGALSGTGDWRARAPQYYRDRSAEPSRKSDRKVQKRNYD
jgi:hypothetical protein